MRQWYIIAGVVGFFGVLAAVAHYYEATNQLVALPAKEVIMEDDRPDGSSTEIDESAVASTVQVGESTFVVTVADTLETRVLGLSGTPSLASNEGKLFLFSQANQYRFWMKDMLFAIDIIWIDEDGTVADITHNATPASYPETTFSPSKPVRVVIEVLAGEAERRGIAIGDPVVFSKDLR